MARREWPLNMVCAEPECKARQAYVYDTRAEWVAGSKRQAEHPWRCQRHTKPDAVLSLDNRVRQQVLTLQPVDVGGSRAPGLYWVPEGDRTGSGFAWGPGWKAFGEDFEEGTRVVVTARLLLPGEPVTSVLDRTGEDPF